MAGLALQLPGPAAPSAVPRTGSIGGFLSMGNAAAALEMGKPAQTYESQANQPVMTGLAGHIKAAWSDAKEARRQVEEEMIEALLARRGEYTTAKKSQIAEARQPEIYMMVAAAKQRQIESLLREVLVGTGSEKPWTLAPSPDPELPPEVAEQMVTQLTQEIQQAAMSGFPPTMEAAQQRLRELRDELQPMLVEEARKRCERMETKMEDQLVEGGFLEAMDQFITDLATFKTAFIAGPVLRKKPKLKWGQGGKLTVTSEIKPEWERVDPFDVFPARYARSLSDGALLRKHRLTRRNLTELIGVDGYSEPAIREALKQFGKSGFHEWLSSDSAKAIAEGKTQGVNNEPGLIDALQYWGSASGQMLLDWGLDAKSVPDPEAEYEIEAWLVGPHVIKAVLNADPLARRPLYCSSFQRIPGAVWGNSPFDLMRDCQDMCNASARAMAANLGVSSGPQVAVLANRIPKGEDITEMYPWKIWQFESDPMGGTAPPITFFQPDSHANELMAVYERFSALADEYTGIPRYMSGFNGGDGGAGRTASGISMMIGNASKIVKQVVGTVDTAVLTPMLERLYYHNMRYSDDADLKGDVNIMARGALSITTKESAQVRMNEFLQIALQSEAVQNIIGADGLAELLRPTVKRLDINPDKVVPSLPVLHQRLAAQQQQQMLMMQQQAALAAPPGKGTPAKPKGNGEVLENGAPVTDNFSPR